MTADAIGRRRGCLMPGFPMISRQDDRLTRHIGHLWLSVAALKTLAEPLWVNLAGPRTGYFSTENVENRKTWHMLPPI